MDPQEMPEYEADVHDVTEVDPGGLNGMELDQASNNSAFTGKNPETGKGAGSTRDSLVTELDTESVFTALNPGTSFPGSHAEQLQDDTGEGNLGSYTGLNNDDGLL